MRAVHLESKRVEVREVPTPERPQGFALIRLVRAGICNTDLELQRGYYGFAGTPGHEFVGEVVECDSPELKGKRVVGEINLGCGDCEWCWRDLGGHCPERTVLGIVRHPGAFAEFLTLPEKNLHVLPETLATDEAVFVEPLAAACRILDQVDFWTRQPIAVLGDGKLGLLIGMALQAKGARVYLFGRHAEKLRIAESAGITTQVGGAPIAAYEIVVDATGSADGLRQAVRMARPRGIVIMKSTIYGAPPIDMAAVIVNEIKLVGSRCGRFEPALELLTSGKVRVADMISDRFSLGDAPRAFERAAEKGVLKVLLEP